MGFLCNEVVFFYFLFSAAGVEFGLSRVCWSSNADAACLSHDTVLVSDCLKVVGRISLIYNGNFFFFYQSLSISSSFNSKVTKNFSTTSDDIYTFPAHMSSGIHTKTFARARMGVFERTL